MAALGLLAAAAAVVSFEAQYRMVFAAKNVAPIAALEAAIPDVAALVFASLGIALALHGRQAIRARVLNVGAVATSIAMNMLAAGHGFRDLAIWVMPPVAYALASDTAIGVIRSHAIARQRELREALAGDETTPLAVLGGVALWLLRLALAASPAPGSAGGQRSFRGPGSLRRSLRHGRRRREPPRTAAVDVAGQDEAAAQAAGSRRPAQRIGQRRPGSQATSARTLQRAARPPSVRRCRPHWPLAARAVARCEAARGRRSGPRGRRPRCPMRRLSQASREPRGSGPDLAEPPGRTRSWQESAARILRGGPAAAAASRRPSGLQATSRASTRRRSPRLCGRASSPPWRGDRHEGPGRLRPGPRHRPFRPAHPGRDHRPVPGLGLRPAPQAAR